MDLVQQKRFYTSEYIRGFEKFKEELRYTWNENNERLLLLVLKISILLLDVVFEKIRNNSFKNYGLCPNHYLSAPAFSWIAMHNMTKVNFKLISGAEIYLLFEKGMRGELS